MAGFKRLRKDATASPILLPGLPNELAESCLARVPWIYHSKLWFVSKAWATFLRSDTIVAIRAQEGFSERFSVVLSERSSKFRGRSKMLILYDAEAAEKSEFRDPLADFCCPGRLEEDRSKWSRWWTIIGQNFFIFGARFGDHRGSRDVWRLNFVTRRWTKLAPIRFANRYMGCIVENEKLYIVAGFKDRCGPSAEMYDSTNDEWEEVSGLDRYSVFVTWLESRLSDLYEDLCSKHCHIKQLRI